MKTNIIKRRQACGAVLVTTVCVLAILTALMVTYLGLAKQEHASVARDQAWNRALVVAEAGVEEAMAQINVGVTAKAPVYTLNGWTLSGGSYRMPSAPRSIYGGSYNAAITVGTIVDLTTTYYTNTIRSTGTVSAPLTSGKTISRAVEVTTVRAPLFPVAVAAKLTVNMNGQSMLVDSYDSSDTVNFPGGLYNAAHQRDHGDVATLTNSAGAFMLGNATIMGKLHAAPGSSASQAAVGSQGAVGEVSWVNAKANQGKIETGWFSDDMNSTFPDVQEPYTSGTALPDLAGATLTSGSYYTNGGLSLANNKTLTIGTNQFVQIYATGDLSLSQQSHIVVCPGATLQIFIAGANAVFGEVNNTGNANNFQIYGLPTLTSLTWNGNSGYTGTVYAPQALFHLNGSGNYQGACVVDTVDVKGHFDIHYDENLAKAGPQGIFIPRSWREL